MTSYLSLKHYACTLNICFWYTSFVGTTKQTTLKEVKEEKLASQNYFSRLPDLFRFFMNVSLFVHFYQMPWSILIKWVLFYVRKHQDSWILLETKGCHGGPIIIGLFIFFFFFCLQPTRLWRKKLRASAKVAFKKKIHEDNAIDC